MKNFRLRFRTENRTFYFGKNHCFHPSLRCRNYSFAQNAASNFQERVLGGQQNAADGFKAPIEPPAPAAGRSYAVETGQHATYCVDTPAVLPTTAATGDSHRGAPHHRYALLSHKKSRDKTMVRMSLRGHIDEQTNITESQHKPRLKQKLSVCLLLQFDWRRTVFGCRAVCFVAAV